MAEIDENAFLKVGDKFAVETFKTLASKKYPDRLNAKILTTAGEIKWTSAANIIKILSAIGESTGDVFEVIQTGEFNNRPVLSLRSDNAETQKKIVKATF